MIIDNCTRDVYMDIAVVEYVDSGIDVVRYVYMVINVVELYVLE